MACCFFLLHSTSIIFIVFAENVSSNGNDIDYTACSIPFSCGRKMVGYPFWGDNRPKFCGVPDFKLSCEENNTSMNVFQNGYEELDVLDIDTSAHTMVFSLEKLLTRCHLSDPKNVTLISTLIPDVSYKDIKLYYGCNCSNSSVHHPKNFTCSNTDGTPDYAYYFEKASRSRSKLCSCKTHIPVPVDQRVFIELGSTDVSLLNILKKWPIKAVYRADFTACSECESSGGRCGSSEDPSLSSSDKFVCFYPDLLKKKKRSGSKKLGIGIGASVLVLLVAIILFWHRKKLNYFQHPELVTRSVSFDCSASELEKGSIYFDVPIFSYTELKEATDNFNQSNELGSGGFGVVFYGKLKDGREVAIKRLYEKSYKRVTQFMNEVQILTRLRHQNLVSLYGCTSHHCRELLLVYEYVKNGTVADHLYCENAASLSWPVRLRIAIETALALSFLHASDVIHRDVKTNNILLDSNFSVKVVDFGLSRLFPTDVSHVSTAPQGTPGYLDPEYHQFYKLTDKSDVYSFGVVLIELISSLPAVDMDRSRHEINLSNYAMNRIHRGEFEELVDPQLGFALDFKVRKMTTLVAELAFQCLQLDNEFRPTMDEVLQSLKKIESIDCEALDEELAKSARLNGYEAVQAE